MYFPVPRLTTSPATMIISICSSEMKRPPTQNWLKNCDFRKIFRIGSKTVTIEHSKILKWTWVMMKDCSKSFVLFPGRGLCLVLYAQLKDYVWSKLLWLLHACCDLIIWDFANGVSNVTLSTSASMSVKFLVQIRHVSEKFVGTIAFCSPARVLFLLFKSQLKTKISANQKLWPIETLPTVSNVSIAVHNEILCKVL